MKFAGHNILIIESDRNFASELVKKLKIEGGNVSHASDVVTAIALQHRWDIDIILTNASVLKNSGDVVAIPRESLLSKNAPMLFAYGESEASAAKLLSSFGVLRFFRLPVDAEKMSQEIGSFLYDAKKHIERLNETRNQSEIRLVLQNGTSMWQVEASEFLADGFALQGDENTLQGEIFSLSVFVPEAGLSRFAVRIDLNGKTSENLRVKILGRDRDRWQQLIDSLEKRQKSINRFLLVSSGK